MILLWDSFILKLLAAEVNELMSALVIVALERGVVMVPFDPSKFNPTDLTLLLIASYFNVRLGDVKWRIYTEFYRTDEDGQEKTLAVSYPDGGLRLESLKGGDSDSSSIESRVAVAA